MMVKLIIQKKTHTHTHTHTCTRTHTHTHTHTHRQKQNKKHQVQEQQKVQFVWLKFWSYFLGIQYSTGEQVGAQMWFHQVTGL
jgi:hypothetical protein